MSGHYYVVLTYDRMSGHYYVVLTYDDHGTGSDDPWEPAVYGPFASCKEAAAFSERLTKALGGIVDVTADVVPLGTPTQVGIDDEVAAAENTIETDGAA